MTDSFTVAKTAFSRVFIIEGRARGDHEPEYEGCMRAGSADQSFGGVERIECPSEDEYGQFDEVDRIQGATERATSTLISRYAADMASDLLRIARKRCGVDVQIHFGACTNPQTFDTFTKALIFEDVLLEDWSADDLGALESGDNSPVNETASLSIGEMYEVLQMSFAERAPDLVDNEVVDAIVCDRRGCGDCEEESDGCQKVYELVGGIVGSPGTPPDIKYSLDGGATWALNEINSMPLALTADALACLGDYLFVVSNGDNALHWKELVNVDAGTLGGWTRVATGFVANAEPNDVWSVGIGAFVVADGGYVYWTTDPTSGVSTLDAGDATNQNLLAIHAISDERAVAVGVGDVIIYTTNRVTWQTATPTGSGANLQAVWMKSQDEWWVVTVGGVVYYTLDAGVSWTLSALPGNVTELHDIQFPTDSVGFVCGRYGNNGRAWRTYNGGYTWVALPEGAGNLPTSRDLNAMATCEYDPNFVVLVGEGATANDGINIVGED